MAKYIHHPVHDKWHVQSSHIKAMLGLKPEQKLPAEGMPARRVQGVLVWVEPLGETYSGSRYHSRRMAHRVMCICPDCGNHMSVGRLHQHAKACKGD